jgi:hypothetical protein
MSRLWIVVGLAGAFIFANPSHFFDHLGPEARVVGTKLKGIIEVGNYMPSLRRTHWD